MRLGLEDIEERSGRKYGDAAIAAERLQRLFAGHEILDRAGDRRGQD